MRSDLSISGVGIGKCYAMFKTPEDRLKQMMLGRFRSYHQEFWALRDVDIEIRKGETVGIVGRNGSGKSTLLQIICGTLTPSTGTAHVRGRISALLELGAGFNPEFTGRENVFISATVAGYEQKEIEDRFDDISAFADIGPFIDQPVKTYSSGMFARLAFAVAIHVQPDILVVDEVLSVGDEAFQRKCFARIEYLKRRGATVLFVSHGGSTIIELCDRAILLHAGERLFTGLPKETVFFHQKLGNAVAEDEAAIIEEIRAADRLRDVSAEAAPPVVAPDPVPNPAPVPYPVRNAAESVGAPVVNLAPPPPTPAQTQIYVSALDPGLTSQSASSYPEKGASIRHPRIETPDGTVVNQLLTGERFSLVWDVDFAIDCSSVRFWGLIRTMTGIDLAGCCHPPLGPRGFDFEAGDAVTLTFPFHCTLNPGMYFCNFAVQATDGSLHHRIVDALAFRVVSNETGRATGIVDVGYAPVVSRRDMRKKVTA